MGISSIYLLLTPPKNGVRGKGGETGRKGDLINWRSLTRIQFLSSEQPSFTYNDLQQKQNTHSKILKQKHFLFV